MTSSPFSPLPARYAVVVLAMTMAFNLAGGSDHVQTALLLVATAVAVRTNAYAEAARSLRHLVEGIFRFLSNR